MGGHGVRLQRIHDVDHVLARRFLRGVGTLPGVAAIKQQRVRPLRPDGIDDGRAPVETAHLAVPAGQGDKVLVGEGVGFRRAWLQVEKLQEIRAGHVRRQPLVRADADIDAGLAEVHRLQLGVQVGDVNERDVAHWLERQKLILGQRLPRGQLRPAADAGRADNGGCRHCRLEEVPPGDHLPFLRKRDGAPRAAVTRLTDY